MVDPAASQLLFGCARVFREQAVPPARQLAEPGVERLALLRLERVERDAIPSPVCE